MQSPFLKQVQRIFTYLDMSPNAGIVYATLLSLGEKKASEVAKACRLNRAVVYETLETLEAQGFAYKNEQSGVLHYHAENPNVLIQEFNDRVTGVQSIFPTLTELFLKQGTRGPKIRFFADFEGIRTVYEEILTNNTAKKYCAIGSVLESANEAIGKEFIDKWHKRRVELGINYRVIRSEIAKKEAIRRGFGDLYVGRGKPRLRDYRNATFNATLPTLVYLFENKVAFVCARYGSPYAAVIDSKDLFDTMMQLFELVWKLSPEPDDPIT